MPPAQTVCPEREEGWKGLTSRCGLGAPWPLTLLPTTRSAFWSLLSVPHTLPTPSLVYTPVASASPCQEHRLDHLSDPGNQSLHFNKIARCCVSVRRLLSITSTSTLSPREETHVINSTGDCTAFHGAAASFLIPALPGTRQPSLLLLSPEATLQGPGGGRRPVPQGPQLAWPAGR